MAALPIIDMRSFCSITDFALELMKIGKNPGFFYLTGHGITEEEINSMFKLTENFFQHTTQEEKSRFANGSGDLGYTGIRDESLSGMGEGDLKESIYLKDPSLPLGGSSSLQKLPIHLEQQRETMAYFYKACQGISKTLLEGFATGMQLPSNYLSKHHSGSSSRMRLIHYPAIPFKPSLGGKSDLSLFNASESDSPESIDIRAGAHSDYGSITLLFQQSTDKGGLQVLSPSTCSWLDVPAVPGAIVVNIGDALEFWTAGRLRSTVHRVVFPRSEREAVGRYSIPIFVQPDEDVLLTPIITAGKEGAEEEEKEFWEVLERKGYSDLAPVTAGQHLKRRIESTYQLKK